MDAIQRPPQKDENTVLQSKDELFELMQKYRIEDLYDKFNENKVTVDVIWKLDDVIINDMNFNALQKLKYKTAKEKCTKTNCELYQMK